MWELEVAQGVPKSERESWLVESVETLLTCGDPINSWRDLVGSNVETKVVDVLVWQGLEEEDRKGTGPQ